MRTLRTPALSPRMRLVLSVLVIGHLLAVVSPPLAFQARGPMGPSPVVATALAPVEGYGEFLYLNRGYAFFAPDPGPSHLFQAAVTDRDGGMVEHMFPDRQAHWPRLLYHRHFMLSEFLNEIYQPPGPPPGLAEIDRDEAEYWVRARARYEHVRRGVVQHLERRFPDQQVAIRRLEHLVPDLAAYQRQAVALDDPQSYRVILDRPIDLLGDLPDERADDLISPSAAAEASGPLGDVMPASNFDSFPAGVDSATEDAIFSEASR